MILRKALNKLSRLFSPLARTSELPAQPETFDSEWYLHTYPDVAAAGMNPWEHYWRFGRKEGRLPQRNRALAWDHHLWRGAADVMLVRLRGMLDAGDATDPEKKTAIWALSRWHGAHKEWSAVVELLKPSLPGFSASDVGPGPGLLLNCAICSDTRRAPDEESTLRQALEWLESNFPAHPDVFLARANVASRCEGGEALLSALNAGWQAKGFQRVGLKSPHDPPSLDNLCSYEPDRYTPQEPHAFAERSGHSETVSVVIAAYNAAGYIRTAIDSLFEQTWRPLEIIVVDDASTDDTASVVQSLIAECPPGIALKLVSQDINQGAYAARNRGMQEATGDYLTTHDADDWSHPEKIARQVLALQQNPEAKASLSWWVRATPALLFHRWRTNEYGWVYPNLSSLMIRREVLDVAGYWDEVKVNADSEYWERLKRLFGDSSVREVEPGIPLSIGRADEGSLSQHSTTHLASEFVGVRRDYMQSARRWHESCSEDALKLAPTPDVRPFPAPVAICRSNLPVSHVHPLDEIQASGLFEAGWYIQTYIDLQQHLIEPLEHFWSIGVKEGRDPGPGFSVTGYLARYPEVADQDINPLVHYIRFGRKDDDSRIVRAPGDGDENHATCDEHRESGVVLGGGTRYEPCPVFQGDCAHQDGRPTILLVGHAAGETLYGAERSLMDVAQGIHALGLNLVVALPGAGNPAYLKTLQAFAQAVAVLPYGWWQSGKKPVSHTVDRFQRLIDDFKVDLIHVNTLVLDEVYEAAKMFEAAKLRRLPVITHVRELPEYDQSLCETLNASPDALRERVLALSDGVIANSMQVARWLTHETESSPRSGSTPDQTSAGSIDVIPNTIEMESLLALADLPCEPGALVAGMISSNQAKKGLDDLVEVARHLASRLPSAKLFLYGPRTPLLDRLLERQRYGTAPSNIEYRGYVKDPVQAFEEIDVLLNLSRFQESFGRTVLEAMAASRPVVVYEWGALPELVVGGQTGVLVPYGDTEAAANAIVILSNDRARTCEMGRSGRSRAKAHYSAQALAGRLKQTYAKYGVSVSGP